MTQNEIMKKIIQGEFELTQVVRNGHRPYYGDEYETIRTEVGVLRCLYFGENSKFCNPRYKK
jgi:hypothetical protein